MWPLPLFLSVSAFVSSCVMCQYSIVLLSLFIMWLASKGEEKGDVIFLKARPEIGTQSLPQHSVGQAKSQGQPRFKRRENTFHLLMGGAVSTYGEGRY